MSRMFDSWSELGFDPKSDPTAPSASGLTQAPKRPRPERSDSGIREIVDPVPGKAIACSSCHALLLESSLFCPKCDAFLGAVVKPDQRVQESTLEEALEPDFAPVSISRSGGIRDLWHGLRRWLAPGSVAILAVLLSRFPQH